MSPLSQGRELKPQSSTEMEKKIQSPFSQGRELKLRKAMYWSREKSRPSRRGVN